MENQIDAINNREEMVQTWKKAFLGLREILTGILALILGGLMWVLTFELPTYLDMLLFGLSVILALAGGYILTKNGRYLRWYYENKTGYAEPRWIQGISNSALTIISICVGIGIGISIVTSFAITKSVDAAIIIVASLVFGYGAGKLIYGCIRKDMSAFQGGLLTILLFAGSMFSEIDILICAPLSLGIGEICTGIGHHHLYLKLYKAGKRVDNE